MAAEFVKKIRSADRHPNGLPAKYSSYTTICGTYDQAVLADFVNFRWLFYLRRWSVGSVGTLWYKFQYHWHFDWPDLGTWTRIVALFRNFSSVCYFFLFFLFLLLAPSGAGAPYARVRARAPHAFFPVLGWVYGCTHTQAFSSTQFWVYFWVWHTQLSWTEPILQHIFSSAE